MAQPIIPSLLDAPHQQVDMGGVKIDLGLSDLIRALWDAGVHTEQCCQGGMRTEKDDALSFRDQEGVLRLKAHLIFATKDLDKVRPYLPDNTLYFIGDTSRRGHLAEWLGTFDATWASFLNSDRQWAKPKTWELAISAVSQEMAPYLQLKHRGFGNVVYALVFPKLGKLYIGSTKQTMGRRIQRHKDTVREGKTFPVCDAIRQDPGYLVYFTVVADSALVRHEEQRLMDCLGGSNPEFGLNVKNLDSTNCTDSRPPKASPPKDPEVYRRIADKRRGIKHSEETRKKLREAWKTRPPISEDTKRKRSESSTGRINIGEYIVTDPNGVEYRTAKGLTDFCREHGLTLANLSKVIYGKRKHHKGWTARKAD